MAEIAKSTRSKNTWTEPAVVGGIRPRVLVFTSLFPNGIHPELGVFIKERVAAVGRRVGGDLRVVAPVPWYPPLRGTRRYPFSQVAPRESIDGLDVRHPRYVMLPKIGMASQGWCLYRSLLSTLRRYRREFDFDIIDAHYVYPDGWAAVRLGAALGVPVVVSARGSDINLFSRMRSIRPLLREALSRADGLVAVSEALRERMVDLGAAREKVQVIPNGIDPGKFRPLPRAEARRQLGLGDGPLLLSVGGLAPVKGFDALIDAFELLVREGGVPGVTLAIVGEGDERSALEAQTRRLGIEGRVLLPGRVPHDALYRWFSAADLFALASVREGMPNVVLESLACGTPVVASNVGGIPEVLETERLGLLVSGDAVADRGAWIRSFAGRLREGFERGWDRDELVARAASRTWDRVGGEAAEMLAEVATAYRAAAGR